MQVYLGLKPKRKTESASAASAGSGAAAPPAPEDSVGRAIDLLNAEFFSTGTQLKHVFTGITVGPLKVQRQHMVDRSAMRIHDGQVSGFAWFQCACTKCP